MSILIRECGHSEETTGLRFRIDSCKSCRYLVKHPRQPIVEPVEASEADKEPAKDEVKQLKTTRTKKIGFQPDKLKS